MKDIFISPNFTIDDIHKVREKNYEATKDMTREEKRAYYSSGAAIVRKELEAIKVKQAQHVNV